MAHSILVDKNYLDFKIHEPIGMNEALMDSQLYATLRKLTLSPQSGMNLALDFYKAEVPNRIVNAKVIMASSCDKYIGWNLLTFENDGFRFKPKNNNACSHTYVLNEFRKCGVGTALIAKAVEVANPSIVRVYDSGNYTDWFFPIKAKMPRVKSVYALDY